MKRVLVVLVGLGVAILLFFCPSAYGTDTLKICCINVLQGDATLIVSPAGQYMLIDAGKAMKGDTVLFIIRDTLGITHLDYTLATHYDDDHIGGMDVVINGLGGHDSILEACYDRGTAHEDTTKLQYRQYVEAVGPKRETINLGQVIDLGAGVTAQCMAVNGKVLSGDSVSVTEENDRGVAVVLRYLGFDFYVGGDLSGYDTLSHTDVETALAPCVGDIDVCQINHHGSKYSTNQTFVDSLRPEASVISVGYQNYDHPGQEVLDRLAAANSYIYQTHMGDTSDGATIPPGQGVIVDGNVWIKVFGDKYTVNDSLYPVGIVESTRARLVKTEHCILLEVSPNPCRPSDGLDINCQFPIERRFSLTIYDVTGRPARTLVEDGEGPCYHKVTWDGLDDSACRVPSGIYFCRLETGFLDYTKKIILLD